MMVQDCQALYRCVHAGAGAGLQVRDPGGEHQRDGCGGPDQVDDDNDDDDDDNYYNNEDDDNV